MFEGQSSYKKGLLQSNKTVVNFEEELKMSM